jgi:O-antigen ligase
MKARDLAPALAAALLVLPALVYVPGLHEPFRPPKQLVSEVLALALSTVLAWRAARACDLRCTSSAQRRLLVWATLPLGAVVAASALASSHAALALDGMIGFLIAMVAMWSLATWDTPLRPLLDWLVLPATILAALMLVQHLLSPNGAGTRDGEARLGLGSLAGNVGDLAAYVVLPALLAQSRLASSLAEGGAGRERGRISRWRWPAFLALCVASLVVARTLVPIVALATGSAVLWATSGLEPRRRGRALATAVLLLLTLSLLTPLRARLAVELHELRAGSLQDVLSGRLDGWRAGVYVGREHPILGAGPGTYRAEFAPAKLVLSERGVPFYQGHGYATHFDHAHNEAIEVFADLGMAGLLASAWLLWFLARGALALPAGGDRALAFGMLAAFSVLALFWFPLRTALVAWPWVVAAGWLLGATPALRPARKEAQPTRAPRNVTPTAARWRRRAAYATALALFGATTWVAYGGLQRLRANRVLRVAEEDADLMARRGRLDRGLLRRNAAALELAQAGAPDDERIPLAAGSHYLLLGELSNASTWYRRAPERAPRAETYLNLGRTAWLRGDVVNARAHVAKAVILSPALEQETSLHGLGKGTASPPCVATEHATVTGSLSDEAFVGCGRVTAAATIEGGTVELRAGDGISLRPGFRVKSGSALHLRIDPDGGGGADTLESRRPP